jgi:hypothetical protein
MLRWPGTKPAPYNAFRYGPDIFASFETVYRREKHLLGAEAPVYS